jgi:hypothetical protein
VEAASGQGTEVRSYPVSAVDLVDHKVPVRCPPGPPRRFPLGDSSVDCSAADRAGNTATPRSFVVLLPYGPNSDPGRNRAPRPGQGPQGRARAE